MKISQYMPVSGEEEEKINETAGNICSEASRKRKKKKNDS